MYLLVAHGVAKSWAVTEEALVIGSGEACDIRMNHPAVSNVHCKVWTDRDRVFVEDLGSGRTMVDGAIVHEAELRAGSRIAVGDTEFELVRRDEAARTVERGPCVEIDTLNVTRAWAAYHEPIEPASTTVVEMQLLLAMARNLSLADGHAGLVSAVTLAIANALAPDVAWWAVYSRRGRHLIHQIIGAERQPAPASGIIDRAILENLGLVAARPIRDAKGRRYETTIVAPVMIENRPLGALVVARGARGRAYGHHQLRLLGAIAQTFAPHWRTGMRLEQLQRDTDHLRDELGDTAGIVGTSASLKVAMEKADHIADTGLSVLLLGESGTGKELIARRIHERSGRCTGPFVTLNCAAVPPALFESEFFGHEAGAFAGATKQRRGKLEEAHGGTLFLDEVPELQPENQVRLLHALEAAAFRRVGSSTDVPVDVRFVAATNKYLPALLKENLFREDLYRRLGGLVIHHPPLRERRDDIPLLAQWFVERWARREGSPSPVVTPAALDRLNQWHWPGNVRELRMCVERAVILAAGADIQPEHILLSATAPAPSAPASGHDARGVRPLYEVEADQIRNAVQQFDGNLRAAAKALGIARATLYRKLAQDTELSEADDD